MSTLAIVCASLAVILSIICILAIKFAPKGWQGKDMLFHKGESPNLEDEYEYMEDQDYWHYN